MCSILFIFVILNFGSINFIRRESQYYNKLLEIELKQISFHQLYIISMLKKIRRGLFPGSDFSFNFI